MPSSFELSAPAGWAWVVAGNDTTDLARPTRYVQCGGAGTLSCLMFDPVSGILKSVTFTGVTAGQILPIVTPRILATGTTVTPIVAMA